jgi:hypothetical protein
MKNSVKLLLASTALAVLAACGGGGDDAPSIIDTKSPQIRYVNADAGTSTTSLYDNVSLIPNTTGGYEFASIYTEMHDDSHTYAIREGAVETNKITIDPDSGAKYTLVKLADGDANLLTIRDPYNNAGLTNKARIRVVNANAGTVNPYLGGTNAYDVYILPQATDVQTATPFIEDVAYGESEPLTNVDSKLIDAGAYELTIGLKVPAGAPANSQKPTPFNADVTIPSNGDWLIVILTPPSGIPNLVEVLVVPDNAAPFKLTDKP